MQNTDALQIESNFMPLNETALEHIPIIGTICSLF